MDDYAEDLAHAATEGHPDPIADELEHIAARLHSNLVDIMQVARKQRQQARWRYQKARGRHAARRTDEPNEAA